MYYVLFITRCVWNQVLVSNTKSKSNRLAMKTIRTEKNESGNKVNLTYLWVNTVMDYWCVEAVLQLGVEALVKIDGVMISAEYRDIFTPNPVASGKISLQVFPTLLDVRGMCRVLVFSTVELSPNINYRGNFKTSAKKKLCLTHGGKKNGMRCCSLNVFIWAHFHLLQCWNKVIWIWIDL